MAGYTEEQVAARDKEIDAVSLKYKFKDVFRSSFATTELDTLPKKEIIGFISKIFNTIQPDTVYIRTKMTFIVIMKLFSHQLFLARNLLGIHA